MASGDLFSTLVSCLVYENVSFLFGEHFWQNQNQRKGARMISSHPHHCFLGAEVELDRSGISVSEEALSKASPETSGHCQNSSEIVRMYIVSGTQVSSPR